ncbi:hypothetical protein QIA37_04905 (plasmid) [Borrelia sp. CA_690]
MDYWFVEQSTLKSKLQAYIGMADIGPAILQSGCRAFQKIGQKVN